MGDRHENYSEQFGSHCYRLLLYFYLYKMSLQLSVFWLCMLATTHGKFLNFNGDLAFEFSAILSSCTLISLLFCLLSFIFALSSIQLFVYKEPISVPKKGVVKTFSWGFAPRTLFFYLALRGNGSPIFFRLEPLHSSFSASSPFMCSKCFRQVCP